MDDRFNTIAGWTLFAGIVALGASIVAGETFKSELTRTSDDRHTNHLLDRPTP